ncbi:Lrp/AsnC family transcriptional regulator [Phaeovulum sp. W22_SRMD_FR3]|uniref:Lrp/AsnC family transcriptional regulator n=1 Tax=Phaeovulum sp. W22_SRMD_FR3 TaxID=3240274 RepID=UPI003F951A90
MTVRHKLDRIDLKVLVELQRNGRISNVELAERVNLSPSPCLMRVKKLQSAGFITGYTAQIDTSKLGETLTVFTEVTLKSHRPNNFSRFQQAAEKIEGCVECHMVSGGYDYLLKFVTAGIADYQAVVERLLDDPSFEIDKYFSYIVIKSPFVKAEAPLMRLFETNVEPD